MADETTTRHPRGVDGDARRLAHEVRDAARDQADALWSDAKRAARSTVSEQKAVAANGIHDLAAALRAAADQLDGQQHRGIARFAQTAAGGLDRMSDSLAHKDLDTLVHDAERFARRQPLTLFATAAMAGFLAVRFVRSSEREPSEAYDEDAGGSRYAAERASAHGLRGEDTYVRGPGDVPLRGDTPGTFGDEPIEAADPALAPSPRTPI